MLTQFSHSDLRSMFLSLKVLNNCNPRCAPRCELGMFWQRLQPCAPCCCLGSCYSDVCSPEYVVHVRVHDCRSPSRNQNTDGGSLMRETGISRNWQKLALLSWVRHYGSQYLCNHLGMKTCPHLDAVRLASLHKLTSYFRNANSTFCCRDEKWSFIGNAV